MRLGVIESMTLDRVNFRLTLGIRMHPDGKRHEIVEQFDGQFWLFRRYDALVMEETRRPFVIDEPVSPLEGGGADRKFLEWHSAWRHKLYGSL